MQKSKKKERKVVSVRKDLSLFADDMENPINF
jgi:hypothetical protein